MDVKYMSLFILNLSGLAIFYFKSFLSEKAKNQATKEDIEEITQKIEGVKAEFVQKIEEMKANLSFSTQHKLSLKKIEVDTIFNYNHKIWEYISLCTSYNPFNFGLEESEESNLILDDIESKYRELYAMEPTLSIIISNRDFLQLKNALLQAADRLTEFYKVTSTKLEQRRKSTFSEHEKPLSLIPSTDELYNHFEELRRDLFEEYSSRITQCKNAMTDQFSMYREVAIKTITSTI